MHRLVLLVALSGCRPSIIKTIECYLIQMKPVTFEVKGYDCWDGPFVPRGTPYCEAVVTEEFEECF